MRINYDKIPDLIQKGTLRQSLLAWGDMCSPDKETYLGGLLILTTVAVCSDEKDELTIEGGNSEKKIVHFINGHYEYLTDLMHRLISREEVGQKLKEIEKRIHDGPGLPDGNRQGR